MKFFILVLINQKHIEFKIKSKSKKEIKFAKGIYTIKYHIEDKKKIFISNEEK